jgi:hypothetical protein
MLFLTWLTLLLWRWRYVPPKFRLTFSGLKSKSKSHCDWRSVSLSVLVSSPIWGSWPDIYYLCDSYGLLFVGRPLWREDGCIVCICCWSLPLQSFWGPSPLGLATIFYCLKFETSLFVASYDSQGHGGGIRPRLHTGFSGLRDVISDKTEPFRTTVVRTSNPRTSASSIYHWTHLTYTTQPPQLL